MNKLGIILAIIFVWGSSSIAEQVRYVTPDGIDEANACANKENPCGSIKHAIGQANNDDEIAIANGVYTEGGITVDRDLLIVGVGTEGTIIQAAESLEEASDRVFLISDNVKATISDLTIRHGKSQSGRRKSGGFGDVLDLLPGGGGVLNRGELHLRNTVITQNSTGEVISAAFLSGAGGGIFNSGELVISKSSIIHNLTGIKHLDNTESGQGGGIFNHGTLTLEHSIVSNNSTGAVEFGVSGAGGGIYNFLGTLSINHSSVNGNSTGEGLMSDIGNGGGIFNAGTTMLNNSTLANNLTGNRSASVDFTIWSSGSGGGIYNLPNGTLHMNNCTMSGNQTGLIPAQDDNNSLSNGGAIYNSGKLTLQNSTIIRNSVKGGRGGGLWIDNNHGTLNMSNTILAENIVIEGNGADCLGLITSGGYNLIGDTNGCNIEGVKTGNIIGVDPKVGPLQNNGGVTMTHLLHEGSPAIDAGDPFCIDADGNPQTTDQRGMHRPVDGNGDNSATCDIGAVEFFPIVNELLSLNPVLKTSFDSTPVQDGPVGTFTITATFTNISTAHITSPHFVVVELSGNNLLINADGGAGGVGSILIPDINDNVLQSGEAMIIDFSIALKDVTAFTLLFNILGALPKAKKIIN